MKSFQLKVTVQYYLNLRLWKNRTRGWMEEESDRSQAQRREENPRENREIFSF